MTPPRDAGGLLLDVVGEMSTGAVSDSGIIRVRGPVDRDVLIHPGEMKTIDLPPGSYRVALETLVADEVDRYGEKQGVEVVAGPPTPVTLTMTGFTPELLNAPTDAQVGDTVAISWTAVPGAASYRLEVRDDSARQTSYQSQTTTRTVPLPIAGTLFFRVRAISGFGLTGVASAVSGGTIVKPPNEPPSVAITSPADGSTFDENAFVVFNAVANDPEEGALTGTSLAWSSNLDGPLGTGESLTRDDLSPGQHTVTVIATDASGAQAHDEVTLTIVPPAGTWTYVGSMQVARQAAEGVRLTDGRVLIVGGCCSSASIQSAELFDPATGTFKLTGSPRERRSQGHTVTRLLDGTVLVVGGVDRNRTAEVYDPATGVFTSVGGISFDRQYHSATLLPDGRVLLAGGSSETPDGNVTHAGVEIYDPATRTFRVTTSLLEDRGGHTAVILADGRVGILGGAQTTSPGYARLLSSTEIFDPGSERFTPGVGLLRPNEDMGAFRYTTGEILLVAGFNSTRGTEWLDASIASTRDAAPMAIRHSGTTPVMLDDGRVLVPGGSTAAGPVITDAVELYVPEVDAWFPVANLLEPLDGAVVVRLQDGRVLVAGGRDPARSGILRSEIFDPAGF